MGVGVGVGIECVSDGDGVEFVCDYVMIYGGIGDVVREFRRVGVGFGDVYDGEWEECYCVCEWCDLN